MTKEDLNIMLRIIDMGLKYTMPVAKEIIEEYFKQSSDKTIVRLEDFNQMELDLTTEEDFYGE